jgi:hypothetical protein
MRAAAAAVIGARHLRARRNGQDAAAAWAGRDAAVVVVCDGCSAGARSEVGAQLGATLMLGAVGARLAAGGRAEDDGLWAAARAEVVRTIGELVDRMPGERAQALHDYFLFTIVAAAAAQGGAAVWVLGDGAYRFGDSTRVLGPYDGNQPPYLAYDLVGSPPSSHFEIVAAPGPIVIATDGAAELDLSPFAAPRFVDHPDALRRELALRACADEQIDWAERRLVRHPAALQDDGAVGLLWRPS